MIGGVLWCFDKIGVIFFTILVGLTTAKRPDMIETRVKAGGAIVFSLAGRLTFPYINIEKWYDLVPQMMGYPNVTFSIWLVLCALVGRIFASILLGYAQKPVGGSNDNSGCCFIATSVYNSPDAPEVLFLRQIRDWYLLPYSAGRLFVRGYYIIAPRIVLLTDNNKTIRALFKLLLDKLISILLLRLGIHPEVVRPATLSRSMPSTDGATMSNPAFRIPTVRQSLDEEHNLHV